MSAAPILSITDVHKSYGTYPALKGVSLNVRQGEFIALVGPSGCGKTTLLKQIAGFEDTTSGTIRIEGQDMAGVPAALRPTSMVKRYPKALSGGEQQRVALARSMISSPKLLLLDEPLSALDVKLKKVLQAELKRLHRSVGVTFVHVTHDLEEAMMLADRICVMRAGKILQLGEPADIYYRPADPFVAGFIGETNLIPITVTGRTGDRVSYTSSEIMDAEGSLPASLAAADVGQGLALMNVRPELIRRCDSQAGVDCKLPATVTELFTKGGTVQYRARTPQGQELAIEIQGTSHLPMQLGEDVWLGWAKKDIWILKPGEA